MQEIIEAIMGEVNFDVTGLQFGLQVALICVGALIAIISIVSLTVSIWLAIKYRKFNRKENSAHLTSEETARRVLDANELQHIKVKSTGSILFGNSYSHYFKKVRIRKRTRHKTSVTALGIGAQKACLAVLDKENDPDMRKRVRLYPIITFGPFAFVPLIVVGVLLDYFVLKQGGTCTFVLGGLGVLFYAYAVVLSVLTLRVEKKAQERAYVILKENNMATDEELSDLKELFRLYNIQYINDIILSSLELIYTILQIALELTNNQSISKS